MSSSVIKSSLKRTLASSPYDSDCERTSNSTRALRQRTSSTSSVETIRACRKSAKYAEDEENSVATIKEKGMPRSGSKKGSIKRSSSTSGIPQLVAQDKGKRATKTKAKPRSKSFTTNTTSEPLLVPFVLNIGHARVATAVSFTSGTFGISNAEEDCNLSTLDMDSLPSIPSPPGSPPPGLSRKYAKSRDPGDIDPEAEPSTPTLSSPRAGSSSPHQTLSENRDIHELRKSLNSLANSKDVPFPSTRELPAEPLRALCPNTSYSQPIQRPRPARRLPPTPTHFVQWSQPLPQQYVQEPPPLQLVQPTQRRAFLLEPDLGQSAAKTDDYGCVHLGAGDCQLYVSFSETPHYEMWDMGNNVSFACPALLYIMAKDPKQWDGLPLSLPDVTSIDIRCTTKPTPSVYSNFDLNSDWICEFEGYKANLEDSVYINVVEGPLQNLISIEHNWTRTYAMPTIGKGCPSPPTSNSGSNSSSGGLTTPTSSSSSSLTQGFTFPPLRWPPMPGETATPSPPSSDLPPPSTWSWNFDEPDHGPPAPVRRRIPGRGWFMRFWMPIPTRLFLKKETRVFEIEAKVWMMGDAGKGTRSFQSNYLRAQTEMTVSHLRKAREMG